MAAAAMTVAGEKPGDQVGFRLTVLMVSPPLSFPHLNGVR